MPAIRIPGVYHEPLVGLEKGEWPMGIYLFDWFWWVTTESETGRVWLRYDGEPYRNTDIGMSVMLTEEEAMAIQPLRVYVTFKHLHEVIIFKGRFGHEL